MKKTFAVPAFYGDPNKGVCAWRKKAKKGING